MSHEECEDLIDQRLKDRLAQHLPDWDDEDTILAVQSELGVSEDTTDPDWLRDEYRDHLLEGVLSVEKLTTYKVLLSTGGPADWFEFVYDSEKDLVACWYVYQDWYDGARRPVPPKQAEDLAQLFCVGPEFE